MRDCTSYRLCGRRPAPGAAYRKFRFLAALLLLLGVLAGSDLMSLQAQNPRPPEERKAPEAPIPPPTSVPTQPDQPAPQRASLPPMEVKGDLRNFQVPVTPPNAGPRFQFKIDPKTPLKDLLPTAPKIERRAEPVRGNDLGRVPEVQFEACQGNVGAEAMKHIAHQIAKINHLNDKKTDGFIDALRSERPDLIGLPFAMGDACRTKGDRSKLFASAVAMVRQAMQQQPAPASVPVQAAPQQAVPSSGPLPAAPSTPPPAPAAPSPSGGAGIPPRNNLQEFVGNDVLVISTAASSVGVNPPSPETFWDQYQTLCAQQDKTQKEVRCDQRELMILTRIAALSQILMPMTEMHPGLAKYLSTISHVEATRTLARLAIFSADEDARKAAIEALKVRRERDYTEILVDGLRYPWPAVARRAADAIVKLERKDLLPQLIDVLEQGDPRAPVTREVKGKSVPVVSELVRVNHHRSCLLCHAPGNTGKVSADAVSAEVPVPGQPLNPPSGGYNTSQPEILVRVDVTYLRQDFSALLAVADANPWPEMQRFDFLVRTRVLSDEEAAAYRDKLKPRESGEFSPYQRAVLAALRELTGRDTEPTPEAWRRLLKLKLPEKRSEWRRRRDWLSEYRA